MKRVSQTHAPGATVYWTTYTYDALGRTITVSQPNNLGQTTYAYAGNTVTVTDAAGKWKTFTTNALGNLNMVTEPRPGGGANYLTYYTYNTFNQLLTVSMTRPKVPADGTNVTQTRTFVYDGSQRVQSVTNPENGTTSYTYNADNTLNTKTDAKNQTLSYVYDTLGRLKQVKNGAVILREFTYDSNGWGQYLNGRLARVDYGAGKFSELYSYHPAGGRTAKRLSFNNKSLDAFWTYNNEGQVLTVKYPDAATPGDTYTYTYDAMGRPKDLTTTPGDGSLPYLHVRDVTYGPSGELAGLNYLQSVYYGTDFNNVPYVQPSYIHEGRSYNARMQLTNIDASGINNVLIGINYNYYDVATGQSPDTTKNNGKVGQMTSNIMGSSEVVNYKYDSLNRLIAAYTNDTSSAGWGLAWDYDGFGNRLSQTVTQGTAQPMNQGADQATNRSGSTFDANGNMTNYGNYVYDTENRLISATNPSVAVDTYDYAPDNKRVYKMTTVNNVSTEYVYFYSGSRKLATYQVGYSGQTIVFQLTGANVYFGGKLVQAEGQAVVLDRLGSVVWDGAKGAHRYFPYGEERTATTNESSKFGTYFRDASTGLDYAANRYFSSPLGRFTSADPLAASARPTNPGSWNRYAYSSNDPINNVDPLGLFEYQADLTLEQYCAAFPTASQCGGDGTQIGDDTTTSTQGSADDSKIIPVKKYSTTSQQATLVQNMLRWTEAAISQDEKCGNWLKGHSDGVKFDLGATGRADDMMRVGVGEMPVGKNAVAGIGGTTGIPSGAMITVNVNGAFFDSTKPVGYGVPSNITGNTTAAQVFILLHELAHNLGAEDFKEGDNNEADQTSNNAKVLENCGAVVKKFE